jgi:multidrug transporter EmrE-like cation transporter
MTALLTSIGTLVIVLTGMVILLQIATIKEVFGFVGRAVMVLLLTLVALCILKGLWADVMFPWLSAALKSLKTLIAWLLVTILGLVVLALIGRLVFRRFGQQLTLRR